MEEGIVFKHKRLISLIFKLLNNTPPIDFHPLYQPVIQRL